MLLQLGAKLPFIYHILNFFVHFFGKFFKFHGSFFTFSLLADSNFLVFSLLFTYIRAIVDERNEKIGRKIRDNEMKRIPYMRIVVELLADRQYGNLVRRLKTRKLLSASREKVIKEP